METGYRERRLGERERECVCCCAVWRRTGWRKESYNVCVPTKLSKNQQLSVLLFAEDQVIIADTEDNLQKDAHNTLY